MRKALLSFSLAALAGAAQFSFAASAAAEETASPAPTHYSVTTTKNAKLIDDPAAAAILKEQIPTIWANEMFQSVGRDITLKEVQQYETVLTDEKLAEIQAALDKIPAKK
ncbi:MAG: hypothetical protein JJ992_28085 [Planctomycetes bacterium]|jgi:hypothetical protein|nr:hypothetical protein [Planctomycetota bacterium]